MLEANANHVAQDVAGIVAMNDPNFFDFRTYIGQQMLQTRLCILGSQTVNIYFQTGLCL